MKCIALIAGLLVLASARAVLAEERAPAARPPEWAAKGVLLFRVSTPDANILQPAEEGLVVTSNLLDGSVPLVPMFNGVIGHDHRGAWNWDGLWPFWNRVTFRAGNSWPELNGFMTRIQKRANAKATFHLNLTDVNIGLRDYPESQAFFRKLVETGSVYRRDVDPKTGRRDGAEPYVPQKFDPYSPEGKSQEKVDPVEIFALVNYKNFWDSGLARSMIDEFYGHLPYAPPVIYLDVLNLAGGNFNTGFPDGRLGGSEQTQLEGVTHIIDYLRSKGTDLGTEGDRPYGDNAAGNPRAGYVWLHGNGFSSDDYRIISGGAGMNLPGHHVFGNPGAFNVAPVACTAAGVAKVKAHYAALLAGKPGVKQMATAETWHIPYLGDVGKDDEFYIPGTGDPFRGDWADLVNYYYLAVIQENYHIGNRVVRQRFSSFGAVHLGAYTLSADGDEQVVSVPDFATGWQKKGAQQSGEIMLEIPIETKVAAARAGKYAMTLRYKNPGDEARHDVNVYLNGELFRTLANLPGSGTHDQFAQIAVGELPLHKGENAITFDSGPIRAEWTDGTVAEWTTPYLRKGFKAWKGKVVFAVDYDRMWPDTWSGQEKIYFYSFGGTSRRWALPEAWIGKKDLSIYPLTPTGRGAALPLAIEDGSISPRLLPQVPYVLAPAAK
jgi:hypothetical protein